MPLAHAVTASPPDEAITLVVQHRQHNNQDTITQLRSSASHEPEYVAPSLQRYTPKPDLALFTNSPSNLLPLVQRIVPEQVHIRYTKHK